MSTSPWRGLMQMARPAVRALDRYRYGKTFSELYGRLATFAPASRGQRQQMINLTFLSAEQTFPRLAALVDELGVRQTQFMKAEEFAQTDVERAAARELKSLFDSYGSDKATEHDYHHIYGAILTRMGRVASLLEIGLGSNNDEIVSNMGPMGQPGASLRAFRDYLPDAQIYGADVDRATLFQEERIRTFFVDQTDLSSFAEVEALGKFDVLIDDGLHAPNANLATLLLGIKRVSAKGWIVIEDIAEDALPVWKAIAAIMPDAYQTCIVQTRVALLFAAQRVF